MSSTTNYCLKGPEDQVIGFRLGAEDLGHEIYDILDWADEHFPSYFVEQTGGQVYVCSETIRDTLSDEEIRAEPLSLGGNGRTGDGPARGGRPGGGPSGGSSGGPGGNGPDGNAPVGSGGGGAVAESAGR
jgi:hypothetical protein